MTSLVAIWMVTNEVVFGTPAKLKHPFLERCADENLMQRHQRILDESVPGLTLYAHVPVLDLMPYTCIFLTFHLMDMAAAMAFKRTTLFAYTSQIRFN